MTYAGIGSRKTPGPVLGFMEALAATLRNRGYTLRSGHAPGADQAFERGAAGRAEIYLPWARFEWETPVQGKVFEEPTPAAHALTARFHPRYERLTRGVRALHARNAHQILGYDLESPVEFVLCWTPPPFPNGGTAQAVRIARAYDIPVFDLGNPEIQFAILAKYGVGV